MNQIAVAIRVARHHFEGREVNAGSNPSRVYEGMGEALAWVFFFGEARPRERCR